MPIQFEKPDSHPHVALVTIDNPARANSLDLDSLSALAAAWWRIDEDESIRVVGLRSEEHTSELQSHCYYSYVAFCL